MLNDCLAPSPVMLPTEYRIIPVIDGSIVFYYLQFRHVHRYQKRKWWFGKLEDRVDITWRYVFENDDGVYDILYPEDCPTELPFMTSRRCLHSYDFDRNRLKVFAKNWPYLADYYAKSRENRTKREAERAAEIERAAIIYLNSKPPNAGIRDDDL